MAIEHIYEVLQGREEGAKFADAFLLLVMTEVLGVTDDPTLQHVDSFKGAI